MRSISRWRVSTDPAARSDRAIVAESFCAPMRRNAPRGWMQSPYCLQTAQAMMMKPVAS
jgi:hypothetical protein